MWRGGIALIILKLSTTLTITLLLGKVFSMQIGHKAGWAQNRCAKCEKSSNIYTDVKFDFHLVIVVTDQAILGSMAVCRGNIGFFFAPCVVILS